NAVLCTGSPITSDVYPTLYARATDNNPSPLSLGLTFEVERLDSSTGQYTLATTSPAIGIASGAEGRWTIPTDLGQGKFRYRVDLENYPPEPGKGLHAPAKSSYYYYEVKTGPFGTYSVNSADYPRDYWGAPAGNP